MTGSDQLSHRHRRPCSALWGPRATWTGLALAVLVAACGDAGDPSTPLDPDPSPTPERIVDGGVDITLKAGTQRVPEAVVASALLEADTATQRYTFDAAALDQAGIALESGRVLLIDGVALRRIATVSDQGGNRVVTTTDAILTDAIQDGTIAWDEALLFTPEALSRMELVRPDGRLVTARSVSDNGAVTFSYTVGEYEYQLDISPSSGSAQVAVQVTKSTAQRTSARFTFTGTISQGRASGQVVVQSGQTQQFDYMNSGLQGTIDLDFAVAGEDTQDFSFEYPQPFIRFPIQAGPVPILVTLKLQVATRISVPLAFQASAQLKSRFVYSGDTGFSFAGGSFQNTSTMPAPTMGPSTADAAALIGGPVDAQIRLGIPRAEFGLFGNTIVPFVRVELFAGTQLYWGPVCKTAKVQYLITAGADLQFLGQPLASFPQDTLVGPHTLSPGQQCPQAEPVADVPFSTFLR